jgi:hypothetical protein
LLSILLIVCTAAIGAKIYWVWKQGPWDLPNPVTVKSAAASTPPQPAAKPAAAPIGVEAIVAKNIFDPERGASRTKEAEADTRAVQRIRGMVLLGTAILGTSKYAVIQDSSGPAIGVPQGQGAAQGARRLRIGDMVEGFSLSEINDKGVVFVKGPTRIDLPVDYFRKVDGPRPPTPVPGAQGPAVPMMPGPIPPVQVNPPPAPQPAAPAVPNITRRPRLPTVPTPPPSP